MNNKGQSLVTFILLIPIIFLILFMVYDIGSMVLFKIELDNINYLVTDYGVDKLTNPDIENKLEEMIVKNKSSIDNVDITIKDNKLSIVLEDTLDNKISLIRKFKVKIKSSYVGYMEEDKKKVNDIMKKYKHIKQLNRVILDEFVDKIYIGERDKETNTRNIEIEWNFTI